MDSEVLAVVNIALALVVILVLLVAAISDIKSYTIPNTCSALLLVAFLICVLINSSFDQVYGHIAVFLATLAVGYGLFVSNNMGAGDAKLLAVIGLWAGLDQIVLVIFSISLVSLLLVLCLVVARRSLGFIENRWPDLKTWESPRFLRIGEKVPLGVAISVGTLVMLPGHNLLNLEIVYSSII